VRVREIPDWISLDLLGRAEVGATARHLNALSRAILTCLLLFAWSVGMLGEGDVKLITASSLFFTPY
jgi:prepilin peptidase CpaA